MKYRVQPELGPAYNASKTLAGLDTKADLLRAMRDALATQVKDSQQVSNSTGGREI